MNQVQDTKLRLMVAWVSWWLMLWGGGAGLLLILFFAMVFCIGGLDDIISILNRTEDKNKNYSSVIYPLIFISVPLGAKVGIWLWAKLVRKTRLVSEAKIRKMGG